MIRNLLAFVLTSVVCLSWLEVCKLLAKRAFCTVTTSRKLIHIGCGLQYLLLWQFFDATPAAPYWCGAVPLIAALRYMLVGLGIIKDQELLYSTSRSGNRAELLKGPVAYGMVNGLAAILCWRSLPAGIVTIAFLCVGDGLAEVMGKALGRSNPLPHNRQKSWAGSLACLGGGFTAAYIYLELFQWQGFLKLSEEKYFGFRLFCVSIIGAFVESLPIPEWDNMTVSITVAGLSKLFLS